MSRGTARITSSFWTKCRNYDISYTHPPGQRAINVLSQGLHVANGRTRFRDITDGTSNTSLLWKHRSKAVQWTKPDDISINAIHRSTVCSTIHVRDSMSCLLTELCDFCPTRLIRKSSRRCLPAMVRKSLTTSRPPACRKNACTGVVPVPGCFVS